MFGRCARATCVLLAAFLVALAAQGALVRAGVVPVTRLFALLACEGRQSVTLQNREDRREGLEVIWCATYDPEPFCVHYGRCWFGNWAPQAVQAGWEYWRDYDSVGLKGNAIRSSRAVCVPRLPAAGLLMLWPVVHWVRSRHAKKMARVPGFPLKDAETQSPPNPA